MTGNGIAEHCETSSVPQRLRYPITVIPYIFWTDLKGVHQSKSVLSDKSEYQYGIKQLSHGHKCRNNLWDEGWSFSAKKRQAVGQETWGEGEDEGDRGLQHILFKRSERHRDRETENIGTCSIRRTKSRFCNLRKLALSVVKLAADMNSWMILSQQKQHTIVAPIIAMV